MIANLIHSLSLKMGYNEPFDPKTIRQQTEVDRIGWKELKDIVLSTSGTDTLISYANSDDSYKLVSKASLAKFLKLNPVNNRVYEKEKNDCDDYSYILMGDVTRWDSDLAFGIVWGAKANGVGHAWNFYVGLDKKVWYVEPMRDWIFPPSKEWRVTRMMI